MIDRRYKPVLYTLFKIVFVLAIGVLGCAESRSRNDTQSHSDGGETDVDADDSDDASDLSLFIGRDETRDELTVEITLEPEDNKRPPCPVFDISATINQELVSVSQSGYEVDESGLGRCLYPTFSYPVPQEDLVLTNFFLGESSSLWREVLGHLDVRVSDNSGDFRAIFERVIPQEVNLSIIKPISGALQVGAEAEVEFNPAPEDVQEVTIVYQPEGDRSASVELNGEQKDSQDSARTNVVFTLPTIDAGRGTLRIGIIPWNRFSVRCDFKACVHETLELFYQNTPLFVSRKVAVLR